MTIGPRVEAEAAMKATELTFLVGRFNQFERI